MSKACSAATRALSNSGFRQDRLRFGRRCKWCVLGLAGARLLVFLPQDELRLRHSQAAVVALGPEPPRQNSGPVLGRHLGAVINLAGRPRPAVASSAAETLTAWDPPPIWQRSWRNDFRPRPVPETWGLWHGGGDPPDDAACEGEPGHPGSLRPCGQG